MGPHCHTYSDVQYDLDFKRYLTKLHLRLEERMKRETVRKKAKWASEWAHGHAERRIIQRQIYIQPNFPLYALAPQSQETYSQEASQFL